MPSLEDHFHALTKVRPPERWPDLGEREARPIPRPPALRQRIGVTALAFLVAATGFVLAIRALQTERRAPAPSSSVQNGLIAFSRGGSGSGLYVVNPDGTGLIRLPSEPGDTDADWSPDGARIAFVRFGDAAAGIFAMNADGSDVQQVTSGRSDGAPAWSPDGTRLAFAREARAPGADVANGDIYVVDADGTHVTRLTEDPLHEWAPAWSPVGSEIAFVGWQDASGGQPPSPVRLYVMNSDGTEILSLGPEDVAEPTWSPDGSEIAFVNTKTGSIMAIHPDGRGERRVMDVAALVGGVHLVYSPTWSPDGTKIAFVAGPDSADTHIYVVNRDGSGFTQLTDDSAADAEPAWQAVAGGDRTSTPEPTPTISAVGSVENGLIAFGCGYHICTVKPDGSGFADLIEPYDKDLVLTAYSPVFSPDGSKIAFRGYPREGPTASAGANYDLYVMNADGSGVTNLTTSPADVQSEFSQFYAQWSSDGSMIAYDGDDGLYVMNADGSDQRKLADGANATWSPDGSWIAFAMGRDHGADLWTIHPDGTGLTQLTQSTGWDELPVWSPDGSRLAFLREQAIYVVNDDGTGLSAAADIKGVYPFQPQWSPDGTRLVFEAEMPVSPGLPANDERNYDIYGVNVDGTGLIDLTPTSNLTENYPVWSPDGSAITFGRSYVLTGDNTGTYDLYTMRPDGTGIERLTENAGLGVEFDISWQRTSG